jgi:integrase
MDRMEAIPKGEAKKAILTPAQMRILLKTPAPDYMRAWLVLGGFCGLRPIEVQRLDWSAVDLASKEVHIAPHVIKRDALRGRGMRERYVTMPDAALRLLPAKGKGKVIPVCHSALQRQVGLLAASLKLKDWPRDCLRHSAASYRLAETGDAQQVASWLGHTTTAMVYQAYARAVPRESAVEWWATVVV